MPDAIEELRRVFLHQGEIGCARRPTLFRTVLGSCVATCLWDPARQIGGLNHFVLPTGGAANGDARFGDAAIPRLIERLRWLGARELHAKVFGGAGRASANAVHRVGAANVEIALSMLSEHGIAVAARRTGGTRGIVLQFASHSGEAQVREIAEPPASGVRPRRRKSDSAAGKS